MDTGPELHLRHQSNLQSVRSLISCDLVSHAAGVARPQTDRQQLGGVVAPHADRVETEAALERRPGLLLFQPAQVRGKVCKVLPVTHAFGGSADSSLDSIVVEVVGEVAHQAGVVHAKRGGGELGIEVGDELGESGLPAGRRCGPAGGECSGQVGAVGGRVAGPGHAGDDEVRVEGVQFDPVEQAGVERGPCRRVERCGEGSPGQPYRLPAGVDVGDGEGVSRRSTRRAAARAAR